MIDPKELRIGNLLYCTDQKREVSITEINRSTLCLLSLKGHSVGGFDHIMFLPIPITPEWLERLGFVINDDDGNWNSRDWVIYSFGSFSVGEKERVYAWRNKADDDFYSTYWPHFKHIHQLQNLYFALTGTELTLSQ